MVETVTATLLTQICTRKRKFACNESDSWPFEWLLLMRQSRDVLELVRTAYATSKQPMMIFTLCISSGLIWSAAHSFVWESFSALVRPPPSSFVYMAVSLAVGTSIEKWTVEKKLGEGGFGAVYKVKDTSNNFFALKVEGCAEKVQVLKMEVFVLSELGKKNGRHFCQIYDKGRYGTFNFVVMTMVGKSLQDLRKERAEQKYTIATALSVSIQCLEAIEDLHGIGYLHRDIKPGNYTIGRMELNELRKVYILDFGMCRKYTNDDGVIRKPRQAAGFRGTVRYAPIACHMEKELCRKDDIETWIYQTVELTVSKVPWRDIQDARQVGEAKKKARFMPEINNLFPAPCPAEFRTILALVDQYKYYDTPDYNAIYNLMRTALTNCGQPEFPYDWEAKMASMVQNPPKPSAYNFNSY